MTAPWLRLSRWAPMPGARALGLATGDSSEGWRVVAQDGREDFGPASPRVHSDYASAIARAAELNGDEHYAMLGELNR